MKRESILRTFLHLKKNYGIFIISFIYSFMILSGVQAQIIFDDDFESGVLDNNKWDVTWWTDHQLSEGIQPEIVTSPVRSGNYAVKMRIEYQWNGVNDYDRTELQGKRNDNGSHVSFFQPGEEYWIGFSCFLPSDWAVDNAEELIFQLHGNGNGDRSPSLALYIDGNEWYWYNRWQSDRNAVNSTEGEKELWRDQYEKGEWVDWVIHAKWSYNSDGYLEIFKNGTSIVQYNGPNCYNDELGIRGPQTGVYKWPWLDGPTNVTERIVYLDEFKVGGANSSYDDVAPGNNTTPVTSDFNWSAPECGNEVSFSDQSTGSPTSWSWDFGDGGSSTEQNPAHTYAQPGTYTVVLQAGNGSSSDSHSEDVTVSFAEEPSATDVSRCGSGSVTLTASGSGTLRWYDAATGGTLLHTGTDYTTPELTATTTYYVENAVGYAATEHGGKTEKGNTGDYYPWDDADASWGLRFDALTDIVLKSVKVYNGTSSAGSYTGERTFTVVDASGNEVTSATVNVVSGEQRLTLNMHIPAGTDYRLLSDRHVGLWRDTGGASYPYTLGSLATIKAGVRYDGVEPSDRTGYYYFFYDWEVEEDGSSSATCSSDRVAVQAVINPLPEASFTYTKDNRTVTFTNTSVGDSYSWDFGDGNSSTEANPVHTYDSDGSYTVTLTATNSCGDNDSSQVVVVGNASPVTASFSYYRENECSSEVSFTDMSEGSPTSWSWDFGDGGSSTEQNPAHTYAQPGTYTVVLQAGNGSSSDSHSEDVTVSFAEEPSATDVSRCGSGSVTLTASGSGTLRWYDAATGGTLLHTGTDYTTPELTATTTYYVENAVGYAATEHGGKTEKGNTGDYYPWDDADASWGLRFDALTDIVLKSVKVYNGTSSAGSYTGERTFTVVDASGNEVTSATVNVVSGEQRLTLNMHIPAGTDYRLLSDRHVGLWRDTGGASYPYTLGSLATIKAGVRYDGVEPSDRTGYYYFFYDWEVEEDGSSSATCSSDRVAVQAVINPLPEASFTYTKDNRTVTFTNTSVGDSYSWDFGDGNSSTEANPVHTYDSDGSYTVTLTATNGCGNDEMQQTIHVGTSTGEPFLDYPFIGTGYEGITTTPSVPAPGVYVPYVPDIVIDESKIIWVSPGGGGDGSSENSPTTFENAINNAQEGTTIIALDGEYSINISFPLLHGVNIISKNKWGAKIYCGSGDAFYLGNYKDIHHINIIGFEVYGDDGGEFIFAVGDAKDIGTHHFYLSDMKFHDLKMGLYTGLHSHDWTVDRCIYYNSRASYLWYMMGWHQTVMNSIMYNNTYYSIAIRGHYPLDEEFDYYHPENNTRISDRDSSWLDPDDWTHMIINNTFGTCTNTSRPAYTHIGIYYNMPPEDTPGQGEDVYFPPQNITIANNAFIDNGPLHKKPVIIFAKRGINTGEVWSVNGVFIYNNVTDKDEILVQEDYSIESIDLSSDVVNATHINFVDEQGRDYRLTSASTDLIDQGTTAPYVPNVDFLRVERDGIPDVGAYEYTGQKSAMVTTSLVDEKMPVVNIFPNPASENLNILLPEKEGNYVFTVINPSGEKVMVKNIFGYKGEQVQLDISNLHEGLYFLMIRSGKQEYRALKFIVKR